MIWVLNAPSIKRINVFISNFFEIQPFVVHWYGDSEVVKCIKISKYRLIYEPFHICCLSFGGPPPPQHEAANKFIYCILVRPRLKKRLKIYILNIAIVCTNM